MSVIYDQQIALLKATKNALIRDLMRMKEERDQLRADLMWALPYAERELTCQHLSPNDPFETCTAPRCVTFREIKSRLEGTA